MRNSDQAINEILHSVAQARLDFLSEQLIEIIGRKVQTGPFAGMLLPENISWGNGDISAKLLGLYEAELHGAIEKAIARKPEVVINIGCADGYYAVGMARILPEAEIYAFDINTDAQEICLIAAVENNAFQKISVSGECLPDKLGELAGTGRKTLVIIDCEGAEVKLLSPAVISALKNCDIIIECHDFINSAITPTLVNNLKDKFAIEKVHQCARNPWAFPFLQKFSELDCWLMVCEFRPEMMHWLACWCKDED